MPIPGRPFIWPLIASNDASFLANFSHRGIGLKMTPKNGPSIAAIRPQKGGTVNSQWLGRDFREIVGKLRPIHHQSGRPSFLDLIANKNASFLSHFSHTDIEMEMAPKMGHS